MSLACMSIEAAQADTVDLSTTKKKVKNWTVREISGGVKISAPAIVSNKKYNYGDVPAIAIPFTNCDGFWVAWRTFHISVSATNTVLKIDQLGVDDRAVVELNGVQIASVGTLESGEGSMQFHDPGKNKPYYFAFKSGPVSVTDSVDLKPGYNQLRVIVNNTGNGIYGTITPVGSHGPSEFGIDAHLTYTP